MGNYDCMVINLTTMRSFLTDVYELLLTDESFLVDLLAAPKFPESPLELLCELRYETYCGASAFRVSCQLCSAAKSSDVSSTSNSANNQMESSFCQLPPELLVEVFSHITDYFDAVIFGMTCSYVWSVGDHRIRELFVQHHAPWKGQRILCLTEWAKDVPYTMEQLEEITQTLAGLPDMSQAELEENGLDESINATARRLLAEGAFSERPHSTEKVSRQLFEMLYHLPQTPPIDRSSYYSRWGISRSTPCTYDKFAAFRRSINLVPGSSWWLDCRAGSDSFPPPEITAVYETENVMVLLNISKRVYVRSDSLFVRGEDVCLGLGRACMWWICHEARPWSRFSNYEGSFDGAWAGDRFDIVRWEEFVANYTEGDVGKSGWIDVTPKVKEDMGAIMKSSEARGLDWSNSRW